VVLLSAALFSAVNGYQSSHTKVWETNAVWLEAHHFSFGPTFPLEAYYILKKKS